MEGCRARRNPISCGLKASGPYHFRARIETFQVLAATFPADLQMTADAIRAARRISGKRRIPRGPRRLRDPISCGSKPPGPYHFRARNQSFQGFAAPFPANALLLSVRLRADDPGVLRRPRERATLVFPRPGLIACGGPTERGEGRLRAKRTIRRSPFGAAALRTDIEQNRPPRQEIDRLSRGRGGAGLRRRSPRSWKGRVFHRRRRAAQPARHTCDARKPPKRACLGRDDLLDDAPSFAPLSAKPHVRSWRNW